MRTALSINALRKAIFGIAILLIVGASAFTYRSVLILTASNEWVDHTQIVLGELLSDLKDAQAGTRGYIIADDERYLQHYHESAQDVPVIFQHLRELTADNASQQQHLALLNPVIDSQLVLLATTIERRRNGG